MKNPSLNNVADTLQMRHPATKTLAAKALHDAMASYARGLAEEDVTIADAMADFALVSTYAMIGLVSGFNTDRPVEHGVRATIESMSHISDLMMDDYLKFILASRGGTKH
ncbi:hypothetical protein [Rhizobium sp. Root483D2]|uniref:hypothetical protein n=1 Tax=Rhizobium sp. Root483D2 TaxID=1736545 RepID=UPI0007135F62|nr:hypothetical protein [Rhizobium sp. Root483D2]KQY20758.1 hypothetical protein ASD32_04910 [Rhizobium sp. Root483D2]